MPLSLVVCETGKEYKVESQSIKTDNLLEFGYEISGLPIKQVSNRWLEVIYGYDDAGKAMTGWIEQRKGLTRLLLWRDHLIEQFLYFESPDRIVFYNNKNGPKAVFKLQPSEHLTFDYIMKPLVTEGAWMKVEVTTPSNYCATPGLKETRVFWIKYLSKTGRPLVWYFTRGC